MYDDLTLVDIKKMEEEIRYRRVELAPKLMAEVSRTREFGDLSENAEYKEAKREKRRNEARIRYLEAMIRTANIVDVAVEDGRIGLFDHILIYNERMGKEREIQLVTTLRQDSTAGYISKESPLGQALMGHREGDRVLVEVSDTMSYYVKVLKVTKGEDNEDLPISEY